MSTTYDTNFDDGDDTDETQIDDSEVVAGDDTPEGPEDRGDEVDAAVVEGDDPAVDPKPDTEQTIPYQRFAEKVAENAKLMEIIGGLAAKQPAASPEKKDEAPPAPKFDFRAKHKEKNEALLEGDPEKALAIDMEIEEARAAERAAALAAAKAEGVAEAKQQFTLEQEQRELDKAVRATFAAYPYLNAKDPKFNPEAQADAVMYCGRYEAEGLSPAEALMKAAKKIAPMYGAAIGKKAAEPTPKADEAQPQRNIDKLRQKVAQANRMPPQLGKAGVSNGKGLDLKSLDVEKMSEEDWDRLTPEQKKQLRGDTV